MSDPHPTPEFPNTEYVRPNHDWVCGRDCQGASCSVGPSPRGKCRATFECSPRLETKPGESKGRWTCTRAKSAGGKCDQGPRPDGTCCNAIPKCQPRLTLRGIRKRVTIVTVLASMLALYLGLGSSRRDDFINPGPVSSVHSSEHFKATSGDQSHCAACHASAGQEDGQWHVRAVEAFKQGLAPHDWVRKGPLESSPMDQNCLACHQGMDFHQANMPAHLACHACHKEHVTGDAMPEVDSSLCTSCHGDATLMAQAREQAKGIAPHAHPTPAAETASGAQPRRRPETGYAEVINSFHTDHPEFRQIREQVRDENALKFNHAVHLKDGGLRFPGANAEQLDCRHCHESDARGEYQRPITYSSHCASCHPLLFDPDTAGSESKPGLVLPHGDPYFVRAYLRSLPIQYTEYARTQEGITQRDAIAEYLKKKEDNLERLYENREQLEREVFFAGRKGEMPGGGHAPLAGCATCHEVSEAKDSNGTPGIAKAALPQRWMTLGSFNHELHSKGFQCTDCHNVGVSEKTSDLNLPSIKQCVDCHSPKGGIDHRCIRCHTYHHSNGSLFGEPAKADPSTSK
jgi:hypothetical protein